jgi:hypothetical protein
VDGIDWVGAAGGHQVNEVVDLKNERKKEWRKKLDIQYGYNEKYNYISNVFLHNGTFIVLH